MRSILQRIRNRLRNSPQKSAGHFGSAAYQRHNVARLQHLESLGLQIAGKRVIEFGAGVGDHTYYYLIKNCEVFATDGREDLVKIIKDRFNIRTDIIDAETEIDKIKALPRFDINHCYGLLYHLNAPEAFLEAISDKSELLLLETCVSDDTREVGIHLVEEPKDNATQAKSGMGCRPSRKWVFEKLKELFPHVYIPLTQPKHKEFPVDWTVSYEPKQLIRAVFIASHTPIKNDLLEETLVKQYQVW